MLPRENRLPSRLITHVLKNGRRGSQPGIRIWHLPNDTGVSRFAFIVPAAANKHAVMRNLVKRRLRDIVYKLRDRIITGQDIVVMVTGKIINKEDAARPAANLIEQLLAMKVLTE